MKIAKIFLLIICLANVTFAQTFTEVANSTGLDIAGTKEGGAVWADFDNDGDLDVMVNTGNSSSSNSDLFQNNGDGTFTNVTSTFISAIGTGNQCCDRSLAWGDLNNDGYTDIIGNTHNQIEIYLNRGTDSSPNYMFGVSGTMNPNMTITSMTDGMNAEGLGLLDYDNDGWLDFVVENDLYGIDIFRNDKSGTQGVASTFFIQVTEDVSGNLGLPKGPGTGSANLGDYLATGDYNSDGYMDILARKHGDMDDLWTNDQDGTFTVNSSFSEGLAGAASNKGGVIFCDFDSDGDFDIFWTDEGTNQIWLQHPAGTFTPTGEPSGITGNIDGCSCADVNGDGDIDLFLGNSSGNSYLYENTSTGSNNTVLWGFSLTNIFVNGDAEGVNLVDYDDDGDLDIYVNVDGNNNQLWESDLCDLGGCDFINVEMEDCIDGSMVTKPIIGATIILRDSDGDIVGPAMTPNSAMGHGAQNPPSATIFIPDPAKTYTLDITFPAKTIDGDADPTVESYLYDFVPDNLVDNTLTLTSIYATDGSTCDFTPLAEAPGGVFPNLTLWLKANAGTSTTSDGVEIPQWNDQSVYTNHATQAGASEFATYETNTHNFNPSVYFINGDNGYFDVDLDDIKNSDYNVIGIVERDNSQDDNYFLGTVGGVADESLHFGYWRDATARLSHWGNDLDLAVNAFDSPAPSLALLRGQLDQTSGKIIYELRDGSAVSDTDILTDPLTGTDLGRVGRGHGGVGFEGYVSEVIAYNATLSATEISKIHSYLAIKYGMTMPGDYTATDGTTIWSTDATYQNDIIVIGRDNDEALYQKQSKSLDDSLKVYIDILASDNASNAGSITNDVSYVVIGHNGERLLGQETELPAGIYARFQREWKITNTNFSDNFSLKIEWEEEGAFDIDDIVLLLDADGDFSSNAITVANGEQGISISEGSIIVGGISTTLIPVGETRYITIASVSAATPLPIELLSFTASPTNTGDVTLDWKTATEINNDFFTIEKSKDAMAWEEILEIEGAGNSTVPVSYTAIDKNPHRGLSYYRLKQTDFDGQFTYSQIRVVTVNTLESSQINIYPNPTHAQITIEGKKSELTEFRIYNMYGQDVSASIRVMVRKEMILTMDMSNLSDGIYIVKTKTSALKVHKQ